MATESLTDEQKEVFEAIKGAANIALVSTTFNGEPTAAIAAVTMDGEDYVITPLAVLVTDSMMANLTDPSEGLD